MSLYGCGCMETCLFPTALYGEAAQNTLLRSLVELPQNMDLACFETSK
jgi:hypothetical protein